MNKTENISFKGEYEIEIIDTKTDGIKTLKFHNTLTEINKMIHLSMLAGETQGYTLDDLNIKYFVFNGASTNNPAETISFRKAYTKKKYDSGMSYVETVVSLGVNEANFTINEIRVFAGTSNDIPPIDDPKKMISSVSLGNNAIEKNSNMILNIVRKDIVNI